jgi:hypothetical protein
LSFSKVDVLHIIRTLSKMAIIKVTKKLINMAIGALPNLLF